MPSEGWAESRYFHLDPVTDSILVGTGITASLATEWISSTLSPNPPATLDKGDVNPFDRLMMFSYSSSLDTASDITQFSALLLPLSLALDVDSTEYWALGVLYVEAVTLSYSVKNALKLSIPRYRPYMYYEDTPGSLISEGDFKDSFPSGHTTMAFTGASLFTYLYGCYHPDSPWRLPLSVGAYSVAVATAALRVGSGSHFVSDVLTGAIIGSLSGFLVPYLHRKSRVEPSGSGQRVAGQRVSGRGVSIVPGIDAISLLVRY
ncbi:MAG: hypothetical protein Kow009_09590 [Spirochaetales bacterium]